MENRPWTDEELLADIRRRADESAAWTAEWKRQQAEAEARKTWRERFWDRLQRFRWAVRDWENRLSAIGHILFMLLLFGLPAGTIYLGHVVFGKTVVVLVCFLGAAVSFSYLYPPDTWK